MKEIQFLHNIKKDERILMVEVWYNGVFLWKVPCPSCHILHLILKPFWAYSCLVLKLGFITDGASLGKKRGCSWTTANSSDPHVLLGFIQTL